LDIQTYARSEGQIRSQSGTETPAQGTGFSTAVLLDNHPLWMTAVENVLERLGVSVVGKATTAEQALALIERDEPDLFIVEIAAPDGLDSVAKALQRVPKLKTIVLSASADPDHVETALDAGAAAYVVKTVQPEDLASTVRQAFEHSVYLARDRQVAPQPRPAAKADVVPLTRREIEIVRLVADGRSNVQVARLLWVTEQTVKFHLSNVYKKLNVANRTEASRWAQLHGLLEAPAA